MTAVKKERERPQSLKLRRWGIKGDERLFEGYLFARGGGRIVRLASEEIGSAKERIWESVRFHM